MTEDEFLSAYKADAFPRPAVAIDLVLMTLTSSGLHVLLAKRDRHPFGGKWSLPGGFVRMEEDLDQAPRRVLSDKTGLTDIYVEQLYTFGRRDRDPRMRIISVAYFALVPAALFSSVLSERADLLLPPIDAASQAPVDPASGGALELAFDHREIVQSAVTRLRAKLDYSDVAFALLPEEFTLRELQHVHESVLGRTLNKPTFRKRLLDSGRLEPTGRLESGTRFRPAELYRLVGAAKRKR